jgi:hypothetical protein
VDTPEWTREIDAKVAATKRAWQGNPRGRRASTVDGTLWTNLAEVHAALKARSAEAVRAYAASDGTRRTCRFV